LCYIIFVVITVMQQEILRVEGVENIHKSIRGSFHAVVVEQVHNYHCKSLYICTLNNPQEQQGFFVGVPFFLAPLPADVSFSVG